MEKFTSVSDALAAHKNKQEVKREEIRVREKTPKEVGDELLTRLKRHFERSISEQSEALKHYAKNGDKPFTAYCEYAIENTHAKDLDYDKICEAAKKKYSIPLELAGFENRHLQLECYRKPINDPEWHALGLYMVLSFLWEHRDACRVMLVEKRKKFLGIF